MLLASSGTPRIMTSSGTETWPFPKQYSIILAFAAALISLSQVKFLPARVWAPQAPPQSP